jgi:tetratricopeptide (TPR) repeat protein
MRSGGVGGPDGTDPEQAESELRRAEAGGVSGEALTRLLDEAAAAYRRRFWDAGDPRDLDRAVCGYRRAMEADPANRAVWANELAVVLTDRFDVTGDLDDLGAARRAAEEAMGGAEEGSPQWARFAATLVLCLWDLYDVTGSLTDLDAAVGLGTQALTALSRTAREWARVCSNIGMLRLDRYERLGGDDDLQEAVRLAQEAVAAAHPDDPELGGWLNNLGNVLLTRFGTQFPDRAMPRPGDRVDLADLDAAIAAYRKAIEVFAWGVAGRATFLSNLGNALVDRAEILRLGGQQERSEPALREAVSALAQAVSLTAATAPYLASRLNVLGEAQRAVSEETGAADDVAAARTSLREACRTGLAIAPEMTVAAADNWMRWAARRSAWDEASEADRYLLQAAEALHRAQSLRRHREAWLVASRGLAQEGAYALAKQGRPVAAAVRLERGRAVLLSEELGLVPALLSRMPGHLQDRYTKAAQRVQSALRDAG